MPGEKLEEGGGKETWNWEGQSGNEKDINESKKGSKLTFPPPSRIIEIFSTFQYCKEPIVVDNMYERKNVMMYFCGHAFHEDCVHQSNRCISCHK